MATGTIGRKRESGTITSIYTSTGTFEQFNCVKCGNVVAVGVRRYGMSGSAATGNAYYFQLPSGFKPREQQIVSAFIQLTSGSFIPSCAVISTDGRIKCGYGSAEISQFFIAGTYVV